ncbi:MAG: hypothetical protein ACM3ZA_08045 [Bacillota bacterium]
MARSRLERRRADVIRPGRAFLWGIGVGLLASVTLMLALAGMVAQRGVQVTLSADEMAQAVRTQVTRQVEADFPAVLEQIKADAAAQIKAQMKNKIDGGAVRISDVVVPLPPEILGQFQSRLEGVVQSSVAAALDGLDVRTMAAAYGDRAQTMVKASLRQQLDGRTFSYSPVNWITIPVTIRVR